MCGARGNRRLHAHHLLSEGAYPQMSGYLDNIIVVCASCHLFGKVSFHGSPFEMVERFNQKFPGRYEKLKKIAQARQNIDYEAEYKELKKIELNNLKTMITLKDFSSNIPTQKQVDLLAQFLIENFEKEIGKNGKGNGEGAIEMAVRLLLELKTMREDIEEIPQFKGTREQLEDINI
jgi:hypothetical protein